MSTTPLFKTLGTEDGSPFALLFGGQGTPWRQQLDELLEDRPLADKLQSLLKTSDSILSPISKDLALIGNGRFDFDGKEQTGPTQSMPGILAAQYGILLDLTEAGFDLREQRPVAVEGHSQGVLAAALYEAWQSGDELLTAQVFALSRLMGAATTQAVRANGSAPADGATPMLSVRGISRSDLETLLSDAPESVALSLINGPRRFILSGRPADLQRVQAAATEWANKDAQAIKSKVRGGEPFNPLFDFLDVAAPFHCELLRPALDQVLRWADLCGLPEELSSALAADVLVNPVDWPLQLRQARGAGARWFIDAGPGTTLTRITEANLEGTGLGVLSVGTAEDRDRFLTYGFQPAQPINWGQFSPRLLQLPSGQTVVDTKFSRLTGRSPILLAGMTPTTVDPEIVAAAANAGHWAELAGGGQVTEEVFAENLASLREQLHPGQTAQFNAMFLDPYLWNLQFGSTSIVRKARAAGAPLDGVIISAGIPELDEAVPLIQDLNADGFPYIAMKPGTVAQIRDVLAIARELPDVPLIIQVEDGHAGGHHSWENLDDLLLTTYAEIRECDNVVLCVGGGIGTPERAADYLSGQWALAHDQHLMPVDGVLVGTAAMTVKEARTTDEVKQLLLETEGIPAVPADDEHGGWIAVQQTRGNMTSGLSHLRADIHEIDNAAAACARLIAEVSGHEDQIAQRRDEIIAALDATSKPYFGDVDQMSYAQWARRFAELSHPWVDETWTDRFLDLLRRVEGRLADREHGEIPTLFPDLASVEEPWAALELLEKAYPSASDVQVAPTDAVWFVDLCRKHPKPMPFVPVLDDDILRWWGQDNLWQSQDPRYSADEVRIIPGPVSVAGIDRINEPVGELLGRFEQACVTRAETSGVKAVARACRQDDAATAEEQIIAAPHIMWAGNLVDNPAHQLPGDVLEITRQAGERDVYDVTISFDTYWDDIPGGDANHAVRSLTIPLDLTAESASGAMPVVDRDTLPENMFALLAATAGVGGTTITGNPIEGLPTMAPSEDSVFGEATWKFTVDENLSGLHRSATAESLPDDYQVATWVPDALLGLCWPAIYAALGSALVDDYPVIEGLLSAVHLDHTARLDVDITDLLADGPVELTVVARTVELLESSSGRVVHVVETLKHGDEEIGEFSERFAIRGRIGSDAVPPSVESAAGQAGDMIETQRSPLRRATVVAPADMTPFANVSGDFNPIHTSHHAAVVAGLEAPLVHGMWLSAVAQNLVSAEGPDGEGWPITGWTYNMYGLVNLEDEVDITVERIGRLPGGGLVLEVTSKIHGQVVSRATATTAAPRTAYVYPGQGIQRQGMGLDELDSSPAAQEIWERADRTTRNRLGFSIIAVVRDNPTKMTALTSQGEKTWIHPDGILNLTQFTQVALGTVAFAQTARLRETGALVEGAYFAGHSLGEYNALSSYGEVFPLETVLEIVFHRGSTMHNLVERDAEGRSNYRMGALRPNQFDVDNDGVVDYVNSVSEASGEFLQIVNFNLADQQYAVAGTIAGLAALEADANARAEAVGGKRAFMYVPGIDVPFHSRVLRGGVDEFREKLLQLLPTQINAGRLVGKYIPNLVATPFELTREFAQTILDEVPSQPLRDLLETPGEWDRALEDTDSLSRLLLVELLCWQFASPVRWIETQALLLSPLSEGGLGVQRMVEIGLASSPTLAGLADKTLQLAQFAGVNSSALNVQRDEAVVTCTDVRPLFLEDDPVEDLAPAAPAPPASEPSEVAETPAAPAAPAAAPVSAAGAERPADIKFTASDAIRTLMAYTNKLREEQIEADDTTDTLTNGASARRNQLLMDLSAELGLASIDGAADATVTELYSSVDKLAHNYRPFGPVLTEAVRDRLRRVFGGAGVKPSRIAERVTNTWQLGEGWADAATAQILLGTREGDSVRGGELATLALAASSAAEADELIDQAVSAVGQARGIPVSLPQAGGGGGGEVVDSAALNELREQLVGAGGLLATTAHQLLESLGLEGSSLLPEGSPQGDEEAELADRLIESVTAELGSGWVEQVKPAFDPQRAVLLDDRWASAREDLARLATTGELPETASFHGAGKAVHDQAIWWANEVTRRGDSDLAGRFEQIAAQAENTEPLPFENEVALVTGMTPASITGQVVAGLLAGGATVITTASNISPARLQFAKELYREHAAPAANMWLVPANLSSYRDIDALVEWVGTEQTKVVGPVTTVMKPAQVPTLFFPFAAPRVLGSLAESGEQFEAQSRLLLWSVERSIAGLARLAGNSSGAPRVHVVLPGSPNRGVFGGDGAYGETKAAFDAITNRWKVEKTWGDHVTLAHPRIGWVRGTGLMGGNDPLVDAAEQAGIRTYSTDEISSELLNLCSATARAAAAEEPLQVDLTGGLGDDIDLGALKESAEAALVQAEEEEVQVERALTAALPTPASPSLPKYEADLWKSGSANPADMVVVVGIGEVSTWGSGRTRHQAELGITPTGEVDLTPAGVLELAWMMGLLKWQDSPKAGWYNTDGNLVPENDIFDLYRDEVVARSGVRSFIDEGAIEGLGTLEEASVYLTEDITFTVPDEETAHSYLVEDPRLTRISPLADGEWQVTRLAGAQARLPRRATLTRTVGGQLPTGFDPARWGIPASTIEAMDRMTAWNLVTAVDAFLSAGFTPAELLQAVHPADVASTQGTGFGGMTSMRKLFVDRFLGEEYPSDILQETLPNVVAAHVMQTYVGGYGAMIHPVGACATAAVSVEEGVDKINTGKATFVVAGAIDDMAIESIVGFGSMNATANSQAMADKGIDERFYSRANDRRRDGFIEAQGGGTILLARGDVAEQMGLPVLGVVGYAQSFADGIHTSIPAPGIGALAAGRGGQNSRLLRGLQELGVEADDIRVLSKHDTSTNANDPNESDLHTRLAGALGRTEGNPLFVISQKTLTGHAKGGAAVFQVGGLCQIFADERVPGNASLDCVDDVLKKEPWLVWLRKPLSLSPTGQVKAALATSLGFGHVSSLLAMVHPGAFEAAVARSGGEGAREAWRQNASTRLKEGARRLEAGMLGRAELFEAAPGRRFSEEADDAHEIEAAMLLDPQARLSAAELYEG